MPMSLTCVPHISGGRVNTDDRIKIMIDFVNHTEPIACTCEKITYHSTNISRMRSIYCTEFVMPGMETLVMEIRNIK